MTRPDQTRPDRDSALELLRIFAMLGILSFHFAVNSGFDFPAEAMTLNKLWHRLIWVGGYLGDNIFVMLSGYFLVKSSSASFKKFFNLWVRMFFYSLSGFLILIFAGVESFSLRALFNVVRPITANHWWFATIYFMLYLLHPYLNIFLNKMTREEYQKFLVTAVICWSIIPTVLKTDLAGSGLMNFICLYSIAGYVRLWADDFGSKKYILYGCLFIAINFLSAVVIDLFSINMQIFRHHTFHLYKMMMPFTILAALCFLIGFKHLRIQYKFINLAASAIFGVYLIHDYVFLRKFLWRNILQGVEFQDSPYLIPYSIFAVLLVYIFCTLIELTRSKIFRIISGGRLS